MAEFATSPTRLPLDFKEEVLQENNQNASNEKVSDINVNDPVECETEEAKVARELAESEALARMLMAEEAAYSFNMQYQFMQSNTADMDTGNEIQKQSFFLFCMQQFPFM
jgi:hypothetical protein